MQSVLVKCKLCVCVSLCLCVCVCVKGAGSPSCCVPAVCACGRVGTLWATLGGAWSHSANGAAGTASESIRPHYSCCSATFLSFFPLPSFSLSSLPFLGNPSTQPAGPVWHVAAPLPPRWNIHHTPRERGPSQLAALTLIDLAPVLTQTPGETFSEREARMGVGGLQGVDMMGGGGVGAG